MTTLRNLLWRGSVAVAAIVCAVEAGNPQPVGAAGPIQEQAESCAACHGPGGHSSMTEVPSLAGQPAYYLTLQLTLFRDEQRQSARMSPIAAALSDSDVRQLSAYFAALPPAEPADGQDQMPRLAGQRDDYLLKAMKDYRVGKRAGFDGTMTEVLHGLPDRDLAALAHYLS